MRPRNIYYVDPFLKVLIRQAWGRLKGLTFTLEDFFLVLIATCSVRLTVPTEFATAGCWRCNYSSTRVF